MSRFNTTDFRNAVEALSKPIALDRSQSEANQLLARATAVFCTRCDDDGCFAGKTKRRKCPRCGKLARMAPIPKRGSQNAPKFWRYEVGGDLAMAVRHYLREPDALTLSEIALMRAYVVQWIDSPAWDCNPSATAESIAMLVGLRKQARRIVTATDLRRWFKDALDEGIDPL